MVVQHNMTAINANRYFGINNNKLSKSLEKLSSGYAINRAGDNAAGLAVSEKMRSQIAGINQGVKNAQDGISMVQTYEGALTETDSILQRMKTLATQAANGSYDDPVDRNAIEQEFLQLNDELDQIADTDFNGVVVLNGGVMADGTKADATGLIDYGAQERLAKQLSSSDINTIDTKLWDKDNANTAWASWASATVDRTDGDKSNDGPESTDVTFTLQEDGTWKATAATNGMSVDKINACVQNQPKQGAGTVNNGGFSVYAETGKTNEVANVILDTTDLVAGDSIVVTFNNPTVSKSVSENIGVADGGVTFGANFKYGETKDATDISSLAITLGTKYKSDNTTAGTADVNADVAKLFEKLNGATLTATYADGAVAATAASLKIDGVKYDATAAGTDIVIGNTTFKLVGAAGKVTINDAAGAKVADFTFAAGDSTSTSEKTAGTVTFELANSTTTYSESSNPSIKFSEPDGSNVSQSNYYNKSEAKMTYAKSITLQVGARTKDAVNFTFAYKSTSMGDLKADLNCTAEGLGTKNLTLGTQADANNAIDKIDQAINKVSMVRGTFGAIQNRLEHKIDNLNTTSENLTSAESRIRDTDMASEMMNFTKNQILSQASQSMLAQANQLPQGVLSLLQ